MAKKSKKYYFRDDPELLERLEKVAIDKHVTVAWLLREYVREKLEKDEKKLKAKP